MSLWLCSATPILPARSRNGTDGGYSPLPSGQGKLLHPNRIVAAAPAWDKASASAQPRSVSSDLLIIYKMEWPYFIFALPRWQRDTAHNMSCHSALVRETSICYHCQWAIVMKQVLLGTWRIKVSAWGSDAGVLGSRLHSGWSDTRWISKLLVAGSHTPYLFCKEISHTMILDSYLGM